MIKEYVCFFEKESQIKTLKFKIHHNQLTEHWSSTVEDSLMQGKNIPRGLSSNFKKDKKSVNNELINLIDILKTHNNSFNLNWPLDPNEVTRKKLNALHEQFHFIEEDWLANNIVINDEFRNALELVNEKIHIFEEIVTNSTKRAKWFLSSYDNSVKITDDLRKFWDIKFFKNYRPGTLFLGYHTIGKNLIHCYESNDVELVKKKGIRPQEFISSEVVFYADRFIDYNSKLKIKIWLKSNKLDVDMSDPKYRYNHQPALGFLETDLSKEDVSDLFLTWNFFKVDIN